MEMNKEIKKISLIIPTYNGRQGVNDLTHHLADTLNQQEWDYELIFVDDNSTDGTVNYLNSLKEEFPIKTFTKIGKKGKGYSFFEGFQHSEGDIIVQVDADLLYSPDAIPVMVEGLDNFDIVVANREFQNMPLLQKILNNCYKYIFGKLLFSLNCDVQSGLKVFRKEIVNHITTKPTERTFDANFLYLSKKAGYTIGNYDIAGSKSISSKTKLNSLTKIFALVITAFKLRFYPIAPTNVIPNQYTMLNAGIHHRLQHFITHTTLNRKHSAVTTLVTSQKVILYGLGIILLIGLALNWHLMLLILFSVIVFLYFANLLFDLLIIFRSLLSKPEIVVSDEDLSSLSENALPIVTVLCPLYKEESILPQFIRAMSSLDYPKDKLQVLLLLEEDDLGTNEVAKRLLPPPFIEILLVPNTLPRTKPKALNWGLSHAKGELVVIYDAEDIPEENQLKKAVIAFDKVGEDVFCLQAKLNFYNQRQN